MIASSGRAAAMVAALVPIAMGQSTLRVSVASDGRASLEGSQDAFISADGGTILFVARGDDLVGGDHNGWHDIVAHDRLAGTTELVTTSSTALRANGSSSDPACTPEGRFVTFATRSTNLVIGDGNVYDDVLLRDRWSGTTSRVSVGLDGADPTHICSTPSISDDGLRVVYESRSTNLVAQDLNAKQDVFLRDLASGVTRLVSIATDGTQGDAHNGQPAISGDGLFIAFASDAVTFASGDTNGVSDVFLRDLAHDKTTRVSQALAGGDADGPSFAPAIARDGRLVVFTSEATDLVPQDFNQVSDVFLRDTFFGATSKVSRSFDGGQANQRSFEARLSPDGRFVGFASEATNLIAIDLNLHTDAFLADLALGTLERLSVSSAGVEGLPPYSISGATAGPVLCDDASAVVFDCHFANLIAGDANAETDVFLRDLRSTCAPIESYCTAKTNSAGCLPRISSAGEPRVSGTAAFHVTAVEVLFLKTGALFFGLAPASIPFQGGTLCVAPPLARTSPQIAQGIAPCGASFSFGFDRAIFAAHALDPGTDVYCQYWSRDPDSQPDPVGLTDALRFTVCPH